MFGYEYKEKYERLKSKYAKLEKEYQDTVTAYRAEMQVTESLTNLIADERLKNEDLQRQVNDPDGYIDELKRELNRARACERMDVYNSWGCKRMEWYEQGYDIAIDGAIDGNEQLVPVLTEKHLVDVKANDEPVVFNFDEIKIDDLLEKRREE